MAVILNASTSSGFVQSADTSGEIFLQNNGTTRLSVLSTGVSGTLVQGTAVASTSGTSIDFTSIPSWVKRITVMFANVSTSGTSNVLVQLGDSGGVEITGYVGSSNSFSGTPSATAWSAGAIVNEATAAADTNNGLATIALLDLATNTWAINGLFGYSSAGNTIVGGYKTLSATLDRVRITTLNGTDTFDLGTINIQYEG